MAYTKTPEDSPTLPSLVDTTKDLVAPSSYVDENSSLEEFVKEDIQHSNNVIKALYVGWGQVKSVKSLALMANTTMNVLEKRRNLALKAASYAELETKKKKTFGYEDI